MTCSVRFTRIIRSSIPEKNLELSGSKFCNGHVLTLAVDAAQYASLPPRCQTLARWQHSLLSELQTSEFLPASLRCLRSLAFSPIPPTRFSSRSCSHSHRWTTVTSFGGFEWKRRIICYSATERIIFAILQSISATLTYEDIKVYPIQRLALTGRDGGMTTWNQLLARESQSEVCLCCKLYSCIPSQK